MTKKQQKLLFTIIFIHSINPIIGGHGMAIMAFFEVYSLSSVLSGDLSLISFLFVYNFLLKLTLVFHYFLVKDKKKSRYFDKIGLLLLFISSVILTNIFKHIFLLLFIQIVLTVWYFVLPNKKTAG